MGLFRRDTPATTTRTAAKAKPPMLNRAQPAAYGKQRALVASAQKVDLRKSQQQIGAGRPYAGWQQEAWTGYDRIGEIHYGLGLVANIMSRVRVYAGAVIGPDQAPMEVGAAAKDGEISSELAQAAEDAIAKLTADDFAGMVRAFSLNISVPGECYLIHLPAEPEEIDGRMVQSEEKTWTIRSVDEVEPRGDGYILKPMRGSTIGERMLPKTTYVARIWRSNARYSQEPDSSMSAIADSVEELLLVQRLVRSAIRSRLNAGILFMPDGITVSAATSSEEEEVEDNGSQLLADLVETMITPVSDEGNAASVVPMLLTGPSDQGAAIRHITFERTSDDWLVGRAERALERILQGLDIPKEVVTGLAQVKYANAIVIDENLYRANIEPLCLMFVDALTQVFLRAELRAIKDETTGLAKFSEADLDRVTVWYDPSEIVTRPNQAQDATDGFDKFLIGPDTWRREHGFSETDAPSEAELAFMLLISKGELPEDVTQALLQIVLPETLGAKREENIDNSVVDFPKSARDILTPVQNPDQVADAAVGEAK